MDIPLPDDNLAIKRGNQDHRSMSQKNRNIFNANNKSGKETWSEHSSRRENNSRNQNWGSGRHKNERNKGNQSDKNCYSNFEDRETRSGDSSYINRRTNLDNKNKFQHDTGNFQSQSHHSFNSDGYKSNITPYTNTMHSQQASNNFGPCINSMDNVNCSSFGYSGINQINNCFDPSVMNNIACATNMSNNIPTMNYGPNINSFNSPPPDFMPMNQMMPPVINSYGYTDVNSLNNTLPNSNIPISNNQTFFNFNPIGQSTGMQPVDMGETYSPYSNTPATSTGTSLVLPMPPLPPVLPKTLSVNEVPLPEQSPTLIALPESAPPPLCSEEATISSISAIQNTLEKNTGTKEVPSVNQDKKFSGLADNILLKESALASTDIIPTSFNISEKEILKDEKISLNVVDDYRCEKKPADLQIGKSDRLSDLVSNEAEKFRKTCMEYSDFEKDAVPDGMKKFKLAFPTSHQALTPEKLISISDNVNSPPKKIHSFPCLGKEEAKKRIRAFTASTNKLVVKEKVKLKRSNPLQDDNDDSVKKDSTNATIEDKKEQPVSYKKKKNPEQTSIAQIKEKEMRVKEMLFKNNELFKSFNIELNLSSVVPGINYFDFSNLDKLEEKNRDVVKYLETKQRDIEEAERAEREGEKLKRRSRSASIDRKYDRKRERKYSRSDSRDGKYTERSRDKKSKSSSKKDLELPKSWKDMKESKFSVYDFQNLFQKGKNSRSRSHSPNCGTESKVDPFPVLPRNFKELHASKRDELPPNSKDYIRTDNLRKIYRGCNVKFTSAKPNISYSIDSDNYDHHYMSQKELTYKYDSDVINIMVSFHKKSSRRSRLSTKTEEKAANPKSRKWYPEDWIKAANDEIIENEIKDSSHELKKDSKEKLYDDILSDEVNDVEEQLISEIDDREVCQHMKKGISLESYGKFFTEENEDDYIDDEHLNIVQECQEKDIKSDVENTEETDLEENSDEDTSKSSLLNDEYEAFINTLDGKSHDAVEHRTKSVVSPEIFTKKKDHVHVHKKKEVKNIKINDKIQILIEDHSDKLYKEAKAKLKSCHPNKEEYKKLKKELKLKLKEKREKKMSKKKLLKRKKKEKKKAKKIHDETNILKLEEVSQDEFTAEKVTLKDVSPEKDMSDYEVIEWEEYAEENEQKNFTKKKTELLISSQSSSDSPRDCKSKNILHQNQKDNSSNPPSDLENIQDVSLSSNERYSPSNVSLYSEDGIDVDTSNMAMDLSSPISLTSSPQPVVTASPSSCPYSPSNVFDAGEYAASPYSPSSPQSSRSTSPLQYEQMPKYKHDKILDVIPMPSYHSDEDSLIKQNKLYNDELSDNNLDSKNFHSMDHSNELKEPKIDKVSVKSFQPVVFKLNVTKQTSAKLLHKPTLAGFNVDEDEDMENTKFCLPIPDIGGSVELDPLIKIVPSLPIVETKIEKNNEGPMKLSDKEEFKDDQVQSRKRDTDKKSRRKSPSPKRSINQHSRPRSRSPKEFRRKSYEKVVSKSSSKREKLYRDGSPASSSSFRRKEISGTPESSKRTGYRSPTASEKRRFGRSSTPDNIKEEYYKKSRSRTPSPVAKWKKVKSPPPKKFRRRSSFDDDEEAFSKTYYKKDTSNENISVKSSHHRSRSHEKSPKYEIVAKQVKSDENYYTSYDQDCIRPISSISNQYPREHDDNWDWESTDKDMHDHLENMYLCHPLNKNSSSPPSSPLRMSLNERLKQEHGLEIEEENLTSSEFGTPSYWGYNTNQVPQQISGSSRVIRVGNVLQVLPQDSSPEKVTPTAYVVQEIGQTTTTASDEIVQSVPNLSPKPLQHSPNIPRKIVQAGNIIEVVPAVIPEQETLVTDQESNCFNESVLQIPLPVKSLPMKCLPEHLSPLKNMPESVESLKNLVVNESPLKTSQENVSSLKIVPDSVLPVNSPIVPIASQTSASLITSNPLAIISSLIASSMSRNTSSTDGCVSFSHSISNQNQNSYSDALSTEDYSMIPVSKSSLVSSTELSKSGSEECMLPNYASQQQAIFSAAVAAARSVSASTDPLTQLLSVLQQQSVAAVDNLSTQTPIAELKTEVDLVSFKQQKRERKERKQRERELRQAKREKRKLEREKLEHGRRSNLSDDEDDIVMKEAITEVPDLGSPVPEYEIYNDDEDEDEQESEKKIKPALVLLPPPEKGILIGPSYRILNITKGKSVSFADGVIPGDGTDVSGGEEIHSPPPPNTEPEKKKEKKLTKKKKTKVKTIKQYVMGNGRMDSPPPPPAIAPNGSTIKLHQGYSYATCTSSGTYIVYTQRPVEQNVDDCASITGQLTIPPGMLFHAAALSRVFPPEGNRAFVDGIMPTYQPYPQIIESPVVPM